jgi:hypothetical protein
MRTISVSDRNEWLIARGLVNLLGDSPVSLPWVDREAWAFKKDGKLVTVTMPQRAVDIIYLSNQLTTGPQNAFKGSMCWLSGWGMSCEYEGNPGIALYRKFLPVDKHPIDGLGILFDKEEKDDQSAALAVPLVWRWDACMMPEDGSYFVKFSNDECVDIYTKSDHMVDEWMRWLGDYHPEVR